MKIQSAMRNLKNEKEFLGVSWEKLFELLREKPMMFPQLAIESFEVYKKEISK